MPSVLKRLREIIITNVHDIVDHFEDPQRLLKQFIRELEDNVIQVQEGVIDAFIGERRLHAELAEHTRQSQLWLQRAEQSMRLGRRDLAKQALQHKIQHTYALQALEPSWRTASATAQALKSKLLSLRRKLAEAKQTQTVWAARQRAAVTQQTLERALAKVHNLNARTKDMPSEYYVSHAIEHVKTMEAKADVIAQVLNPQSQMEDDFLALEMKRTIDGEIAEIELKLQRETLEQPELPEPTRRQEVSSNNHSAGTD